MEPWMIGIVVPLALVTVPITAIITSHRQKLAEIKARSASGLAPEIRAELSEIKNQLADLRDTTTKFDMTFDAALGRLEARVGRVEARTTGGVTEEAATVATRR